MITKKETELLNFAKRLFIASQLLNVEHIIHTKDVMYVRIDVVLKAKNKPDTDFHGLFNTELFDINEAVFEFSGRCLNYMPKSIPTDIKFVYLDSNWKEVLNTKKGSIACY